MWETSDVRPPARSVVGQKKSRASCSPGGRVGPEQLSVTAKVEKFPRRSLIETQASRGKVKFLQ